MCRFSFSAYQVSAGAMEAGRGAALVHVHLAPRPEEARETGADNLAGSCLGAADRTGPAVLTRRAVAEIQLVLASGAGRSRAAEAGQAAGGGEAGAAGPTRAVQAVVDGDAVASRSLKNKNEKISFKD